MKTILICAFVCFISFACKHKSYNCGLDCADSTEKIIFQTEFNNCSISNISDSWYDIHGVDTSFFEFNDWDLLDEHKNIGNFKINCEDGDENQRGVQITTDPQNSTNSVLKFYIKEPHIREAAHKKARVQADLNLNNCIYEFYQTVRLYLDPQMEQLQLWDEEFYWLSLFEFWNNANWNKEKFPFRVTVNIVKPEKGKVDGLQLHVKGDVNERVGKWEVIWEEYSSNFYLPIATWMDVEVYIKEGDENTGKFYLAITPENGQKQIIFNTTNITHHPDETCPDGFTDIHPLKFYTSQELVEYMQSNSKELVIYWDSWKMYVNKKPVY